jgi:hypothetical protein
VIDDGPAPPDYPLARAWFGSSQANRVLAAGAVVAVVLAGGAGALLTGGDDDEPLRRTTAAAASASPSASASPTASVSPVAAPQAPSPSASPSAVTPAAPSASPPAEPSPSSAAPTPSASASPPAVLQLRGDDLGVTGVGAPYADAVRAVTAVLGPPVADPAPTTACVGAGEREVEWAEFRLAITDGRVSGWSSTDGRLSTPSGVGIGTTLTQMLELYGDRLELYEASPDSGPGFAVAGVELGGSLTGATGDDRVTAFFNRACSPP